MNKEIVKQNLVIRKEKKLNFDPDPKWARVFMDIDSPKESDEAISILRNAGFCVTTLPASGIVGPRLKVGINIFQGLDEIKKFVSSQDSSGSENYGRKKEPK
jgi:hypothetical protein